MSTRTTKKALKHFVYTCDKLQQQNIDTLYQTMTDRIAQRRANINELETLSDDEADLEKALQLIQGIRTNNLISDWDSLCGISKVISMRYSKTRAVEDLWTIHKLSNNTKTVVQDNVLRWYIDAKTTTVAGYKYDFGIYCVEIVPSEVYRLPLIPPPLKLIAPASVQELITRTNTRFVHPRIDTNFLKSWTTNNRLIAFTFGQLHRLLIDKLTYYSGVDFNSMWAPWRLS